MVKRAKQTVGKRRQGVGKRRQMPVKCLQSGKCLRKQAFAYRKTGLPTVS